MRDYIHIKDLHWQYKALEFLKDNEDIKNKNNFEIFNVGTEEAIVFLRLSMNTKSQEEN